MVTSKGRKVFCQRIGKGVRFECETGKTLVLLWEGREVHLLEMDGPVISKFLSWKEASATVMKRLDL